jgi:hypothetical protein
MINRVNCTFLTKVVELHVRYNVKKVMSSSKLMVKEINDFEPYFSATNVI